jgi:fatty acid synthase
LLISPKKIKLFIQQQSIQWGGIGDVGMAYILTRGNEEKEINGTLAQKISSCLTVLDTLLTQSSAIVASHVIPSKRKQSNDTKSQSLTETVAEIMGKLLS